MKLTKLLLEYPGAFTPAPDDEVERNKEDWEETRSVTSILRNYIEKGSKGDLNLGGEYGQDDGEPSTDLMDITSLPDNLTVDGDFIIIFAEELLRLPRNLTVKGDLHMDWSGVEALPDDLKVGGSIYAAACTNLRYIPENFTVNGDLIITNAYNLRHLPKGLTVKKELTIAQTGIKSVRHLPNDLQAGKVIFEP